MNSATSPGVLPDGKSAAKQWWTLSPAETLASLATNDAEGLSAQEATARLEQYGKNELTEEPPIPLWKKVFDHFNELVVWILIAAAIVSGLIGEWIDAAAIAAIVVMNVAIGLFQEERASRALAALRKLSSPVVRVMRGGRLESVDAGEVVPGDLLELEAGDNIPADVRLLKSFGFRTQEAALTGESTPVDKHANDVLDAGAQIADRRNMAFMGSAAAAGRARGVVVATGMATELGQIAGLLQRYAPEPTPLQRRLAGLGRVLIVVCLVVVAIVFALNLYRGGEFLEVLLLSISLAVAAVPEGLPAVVTLTLAVGLQRMVRRNALIRKLPSVETLGAVTVICTDKTGTLTRNEMTVREVLVGDRRYRVTGTGYAPLGEFVPMANEEASAAVGETSGESIAPAHLAELQRALAVGARCNGAALREPSDDADAWTVVGDPTEGALLVAARKAAAGDLPGELELVHEIPFDSDRKAMSKVYRHNGGQQLMYVKGAPEVVLGMCVAERRDGGEEPLTDARRKQIHAVGAEMAARALRVLALAYRELPADDADYREDNLVLAGLAGMIDPPREEAIAAVRQCRQAGIRPVMITGDHPATAEAIAREIGIARAGDRLVTGVELDALADDQLQQLAPATAIYARVSAKHKLRVVEAWQRQGEVVAMTGDGVNDAPAVRVADIGVAMGVTGSDVTKETADMVLTDDNFASIVSAVEEGRGIFDNIQKFVHYLLSCNAGEVLVMVIAGAVGWPAPLTALQILWINLVTDGLPALALGMEPPERDVMQRAPRDKREPVITWARGRQILTHGALMAAVAAATFWFVYRGEADQLELAKSATFCVMAFTQLFYSLSCRSQRDTLPEIGLLSNGWLVAAIAASATLQLVVLMLPATQAAFDVAPELWSHWPLVLGASLAPVTVVELWKLRRRWTGGAKRSSK
ncbi:MAG: cation-translocating P-type ATPase [Planctomycetales bacterium]|nr:cation-translocating P-type ATPase [Planctomycetales bacterium]